MDDMTLYFAMAVAAVAALVILPTVLRFALLLVILPVFLFFGLGLGLLGLGGVGAYVIYRRWQQAKIRRARDFMSDAEAMRIARAHHSFIMGRDIR